MENSLQKEKRNDSIINTTRKRKNEDENELLANTSAVKCIESIVVRKRPERLPEKHAEIFGERFTTFGRGRRSRYS